ncbi:histidine kinase N-terminal 7TM domain-containing protein [Aquibacillus rhizosphaerae]|uniref:Histidine kinase N-terminal 7TM domain-containing protein n=1 Tax=Aquibacillus rhizosphaerae TaxID=3051431 RepID=A0ABT7L1Y5_9BACI|nr:histidine kinase N-terminal 7TM domain-containing protein [Aquibacillus sp. LR5S19]MDL4839866.1 histidine kinase N-terminal 7TM domain-containing protein [Aquibacillus sp. LR5S19]
MNTELTAYITLVCTSSVLIIYLCLYVFMKRHKFKNIANWFILYSLSITIYCIGSAFGLMSTTLQEMKFWTIVQYIGMPVSSPLGLLFIMHYLGIKITKRKWIPLIIIPFISLVMVVTNDFHHLHYRVYAFDSVLGAPFVHQEIGIWYMIHGMFTFACMFIAFFLLISHWKETAKVYRPQLIALLFGQLVPMLTAFIYLIGLTPPGIDPVPMSLWLTSLLYVWAISSSRLFSIIPIAKDAIFNSIDDGVIVLDDSYRIIEFNQACESLFPNINKSMLGENFTKVWSQLSSNPFPYNIEPNIHGELRYKKLGNENKIYQVRSTKMQKTNNSNGLLLLFSDITEVKELQEKLEHQAYYDDLTQIYNRRAFFEQCQQSLDASMKSAIPFSVILIDIDYFKKVNDTYGHLCW